VVLKFGEGSQPDQNDLLALGISKIFGNATYFSVYIPYTNLGKLHSAFPDLKSVENPMNPYPHVITGEEVGLFGCSNYISRGFDGTGVKVAVIDGGFHQYQNAITAGVLPGNVVVVNKSSSPTFDDMNADVHGTAVAEVIHEIAPEASLTLIRISDGTGMIDAVDYCKANGIRIINHSMGWFMDGWGDGDSDIYNFVVKPAFNNNILWVNSAGNEAQHHYQSAFADSGNGKFHDFSGNPYCSVTVPGGGILNLYMTWNSFSLFKAGSGVGSYQLVLYPDTTTNSPLTSARLSQASAPPALKVSYTNKTGSSVPYYFRVRYLASPANEFQIFASYTISPFVSARSIVSPNDGLNTLSVAAVGYSNWQNAGSNTNVIETYSSRGPNQAGLLKPDISGIDDIQNWVYGRFSGTSAASPSVAGLAALILSKQSYLTSYQLFWILKDNALDIGVPGPDDTFGYGEAKLELMPLRRNNNVLSSNVIVAPTIVGPGLKVYYFGISDVTSVKLRSLLGVLVKEFKPVLGVFATGANVLDLSGLNLPDGVYILQFEESNGRRYDKKIIIHQ
jgi:subtilisin family serine protease